MSQLAIPFTSMIKTLKSTKFTPWPREGKVKVGGNGRAEGNDKCKHGGSKIGGNKTDGNEVRDNKIEKKGQKHLSLKNCLSSKR